MPAGLRIIFAGTPDFAVPALEAIAASGHTLQAVYTQPDRPAGRGRKLGEGAVKQAAVRLGLPIEQPVTLKEPDAVARLAGHRPDAVVVAAYGLLLPQAILDVPPRGCFNIHASLLPRWRGAAPIQHALLAGDPETGISIMRMEAGLDTGPILSRCPHAIGVADTAASLHDALAVLGARLIVAALDDLAAGVARFEQQDPRLATRAPKITKAQAAIDWTCPAGTIERMVRAFNPWPVAETRLGGRQLRIWQGRVAPPPSSLPKPGTVLAAGPEGIFVMTGAGTLVIDRLQLAGRRALGAAEFIRAHDIVGAVLGPG
jgi:methionyl-tRNA formyltransferase